MIVSQVVALRKESVDRNVRPPAGPHVAHKSLSARRAWIEINVLSQPGRPKRVALRKESVDRNYMGVTVLGIQHRSLSARRAWIEMNTPPKEHKTDTGRSPQGERG